MGTKDGKPPKDRGPLRLVSEAEGIEPQPLPWEKQEGETSKRFDAFKTYLSLEPRERSIFNAADKAGVKMSDSRRKKRKPPRSWAEWSTNHNWVERAAAWDAHLEAIEAQKKREALEHKTQVWAERREQHREEEFQLAQDLVKKAKDMLSWPLERTEVVEQYEDGRPKTIIIKPVKWSLRDAATFVDCADKIARLAADMATSRGEDKEETMAKIEAERVALQQILQDPDTMRAAEIVARRAMDKEGL